MNFRVSCFAIMTSFMVGGPASAADSLQEDSPKARVLLETYCMDCHGEDSQKGDVRLDNLAGCPALLCTMLPRLSSAAE